VSDIPSQPTINLLYDFEEILPAIFRVLVSLLVLKALKNTRCDRRETENLLLDSIGFTGLSMLQVTICGEQESI